MIGFNVQASYHGMKSDVLCFGQSMKGVVDILEKCIWGFKWDVQIITFL